MTLVGVGEGHGQVAQHAARVDHAPAHRPAGVVSQQLPRKGHVLCIILKYYQSRLINLTYLTQSASTWSLASRAARLTIDLQLSLSSVAWTTSD